MSFLCSFAVSLRGWSSHSPSAQRPLRELRVWKGGHVCGSVSAPQALPVSLRASCCPGTQTPSGRVVPTDVPCCPCPGGAAEPRSGVPWCVCLWEEGADVSGSARRLRPAVLGVTDLRVGHSRSTSSVFRDCSDVMMRRWGRLSPRRCPWGSVSSRISRFVLELFSCAPSGKGPHQSVPPMDAGSLAHRGW